MTHYNLQCLANPAGDTFASRFTLPLWNYIVSPPKPEDKPYLGRYKFSTIALAEFLNEYHPAVGDVLELFWLRRRVKFVGVNVKVTGISPGLTLQLITNSGVLFDPIDAGVESDNTYAVNGGLLNIATNLAEHSIVIDNPDYLGVRLDGNVGALAALDFTITLSTTEEFSTSDPTNAPEQQ